MRFIYPIFFCGVNTMWTISPRPTIGTTSSRAGENVAVDLRHVFQFDDILYFLALVWRTESVKNPSFSRWPGLPSLRKRPAKTSGSNSGRVLHFYVFFFACLGESETSRFLSPSLSLWLDDSLTWERQAEGNSRIRAKSRGKQTYKQWEKRLRETKIRKNNELLSLFSLSVFSISVCPFFYAGLCRSPGGFYLCFLFSLFYIYLSMANASSTAIRGLIGDFITAIITH
jgi:hypothetical protein